MKQPWMIGSLALLFLIPLGSAQAAEVYVGVNLSNHPVRERYRDSWERRHHRYDRPVVIAPAPYYGGYTYPAYVAPAPAADSGVPLTGNYANDLANLNEDLSRLRRVVERQNQKETITQEQYHQFLDILNGIEHDEHARAYARGGNLAPEDFTDLYSRLDQTREDVETALAQ